MASKEDIRLDTDRAHRVSIERVIAWMRQGLAEPLDLGKMADVAIMSPYHFLRTFRQVTGVPPKQFLAAMRVEAAKRLLLETERSVLEICFDVGYSSLGTFTRRFTDLVGLAPGRFRQLAESFYPNLDALLAVAASCPLPEGGSSVRCSVVRMRPDQVVFAGLFDTPVPQGRPLSCAVLLANDDSFELATSACSGRGAHLFAVAMDAGVAPIDLLVGGRAVCAVASAGPLMLRNAERQPDQRLVLDPLDPCDPPMLLALPLLLHERVAELGYENGMALNS